ncbi:MAG: chemotaxis protein CheB [Cytophagales bacterium]|nr:chemotaxis protein CheB [Bernardetiaceae bacterium]MDW8211000.1 chemotaxis protein CheB [Cytophagales bacterium]
MSSSSVDAVVIGGSAGSIRALRSILQRIEMLPVPLLVALHRPASDPNSSLRSVLQSASKMHVIEPSSETYPLPGCLYLAPANCHLTVESNRRLELSNSPLVHYSRPSIDVLFMSAAEVYRSRLLGILLTGANQDGAMGMKLIKNAGGIAIVQDPEDCMIDTMPRAAMKITTVDAVLSAAKIADWLNNFFQLT